MGLSLKQFLAELAKYIDISSEMQVGAVDYACSSGGVIYVKELSEILGLSYKQTLDLMTRLKKRGLVVRRGIGVYSLTERGRELCNLMEKLKPSTESPFKVIKLLLIVGSGLSDKLSLKRLMKLSRMKRDELIRILSEWGRFYQEGGEEYFEFSVESEKRFRELVRVLGIGPLTLRILRFLTRGRDLSSILMRFLIIYLSVSMLVIYDILTGHILGVIAASLWMVVTVIFIILFAFKK
ncbi:MAG: hypothetical protein DRJ51_08305 [Thermoprotei archaeon]|nr:MAG: hypothetical protein DRJ51_08305 [Thermoprotei archaeon]